MAFSSRLDYLLSKAQVPSLHRRQIRRKAFERFEQFMQEQLDKGNFCVLVSGIAGSGKTNLVCDFLWHRSDVCGHYFKQIVWLTDRNTDPKNVGSLGLDALLLLPDAIYINLDDSHDKTSPNYPLHDKLRLYQRSQTVKIMLSKCLANCASTLIIIDDVLLQETVDLFANLKCSIIATSTRAEIFDHVDRCQNFRLTLDDTYVEDVVSLCCNYDIDSIGEHSAREIIRHTGGNFALMEKLLILARSDTQRLQVLLDQLEFGQLDMVKCVSYYQYSSLNTCFKIMTKMINRSFVENISTLAVLQPSTWIDIDVVSLIWPVDMPDSNQGKMSLLVSKDMSILSRNSFVEHQIQRDAAIKTDRTRIDPILRYYLLSIADPQSLLSTLKFFKRDLQKEKIFEASTEKLFKKYFIDNEANLQNLEKLLKQPKRRAATSTNVAPARTWFSSWLTYFWSSN